MQFCKISSQTNKTQPQKSPKKAQNKLIFPGKGVEKSLPPRYSKFCSGKSGHSVGPGLDNGQDGIVLIGTDPDLVTTEGDIVGFAVCVMALELAGISIAVCIADGITANGMAS